MTARNQPRALGRQPRLDGLRGLAISLVLLRHAFPEQFGGAGIVGVTLFFVLSGFLISSLLLDENDSRGRVHLRNFYARRALRLLPALYVMLLVFIPIAYLSYANSGDFGPAALYVLVVATYITPLQSLWDPFIPSQLGPMWTLGVEELFYIGWPVVFLLLVRQRVRRMAVPLLIMLISAGAFLRVGSWFLFGTDIYSVSSTWFDALLMGCLLAFIWRERALVPRSWTVATAWVVLAALALWPDLKDQAFAYLVGLTLIEISTVVLLASATSGVKSLAVSWLDWSVIQYLGRRSYGLYLYNALFFFTDWNLGRGVINASVCIGASLLAAEISYRLIERPALKMKKRFELDRPLEIRQPSRTI